MLIKITLIPKNGEKYMTKSVKPRLLRSFAAFILIAAFMCSLVPFAGFADGDDDDFQTTLSELAAKKDEATQQRKDAESKVAELEGLQEELIQEKIALEARNAAVVDEISLIEQTLALYDTRIERKQLLVEDAEKHVQEQLTLYQNRVRAMEERGTYSIFDLIFNAHSFAQLISSIDDYRIIMENDRLIYDNLQQARTEHEERLNEFISVREESEAAKTKLEAELEELLEEIGASKASIEELTAAIAEAEEQVLAAARAEAAAGAAAAEFVRDYLAKKAAEEAAKREEEERREQQNGGIEGGININDFIGNGGSGDNGGSDNTGSGDNGGNSGSSDSSGSTQPPADSGSDNTGSDNTGSGDNSGDSSYGDQPSGGGDNGGNGGNDNSGSTQPPADTGSDNTGSGEGDVVEMPGDNGGSDSTGSDNSGDSSYGDKPSDGGNNGGGNSGNGGNGGNSGNNGGSSSGGAGTANGYFVWPFPGHYCITSTFGYRESTKTTHTGIDIDGYQSMGSPIVAADGGVVIMSQYYGGYGNCIMIDHGNGLITLYSHMSGLYVSVGDKVSQGQTIAGVGNTGTVYGADGIHLHFEVYSGGAQVNPLGYLGGNPYYFY